MEGVGVVSTHDQELTRQCLAIEIPRRFLESLGRLQSLAVAKLEGLWMMRDGAG